MMESCAQGPRAEQAAGTRSEENKTPPPAGSGVADQRGEEDPGADEHRPPATSRHHGGQEGAEKSERRRSPARSAALDQRAKGALLLGGSPYSPPVVQQQLCSPSPRRGALAGLLRAGRSPAQSKEAGCASPRASLGSLARTMDLWDESSLERHEDAALPSTSSHVNLRGKSPQASGLPRIVLDELSF